MHNPVIRSALPPLPPGDPPEDTARQAAQMLHKIGWEPAQLAQLALYAGIPPARKIAAMLALRHQAWQRVRDQLAQDHPDLGPADLARLVQQHVAACCDY